MTCILNLNGSQNCRVLQVFAFLSGDRIRYLSEVLLRPVFLVDQVSLVHSSVCAALVSFACFVFSGIGLCRMCFLSDWDV